MIAKIIEFGKKYHSEALLGIIVASMCLISFNLGKLSTKQTKKFGFAIISSSPSIPSPSKQLQNIDPRVVVSKASSSKLYHFTWCSGAQRITEKNKTYFPNESSAIAAGYTLATNCQK